jgi:DNA polymerase III delta subunit
MLYVFHGPLIDASVKKALALVESLRTKRPDAAFIRIEAKEWSPQAIEGHLGGQGLFSSKYIVLLDRVTENAEAKEQLADLASSLQESQNIFIVLEGKLNAELKKAFEKHAEKAVVSEEAVAKGWPPKGEFNIFALADALGTRDALKAWTIYRQAIDSGLEPENIIGTLFWQSKSMALAAPAKTGGESGLSPFVFSKSKKYAANYSAQEIAGLNGRLIKLYHDGHRGIVDLEHAVERLLLGIGRGIEKQKSP